MTCKTKGIKGCIKSKTLQKKASLFFEHVHVEGYTASDKDLWLVCAGLKIGRMRAPVYYHGVSETAYFVLISDLLQADLESFGLHVGRPIPNEFGGVTYLVCK